MGLDWHMNVVDDLTLNIKAGNVATCQKIEDALYSFAREALTSILDKVLEEENLGEDVVLDSLTVDVDEICCDNPLEQLEEKLPAALKKALSKSIFKKRVQPTLSMLSEVYRRILPMESGANLEKEFEKYAEEWLVQNPNVKFDPLRLSEYVIKLMMREFPHVDSRQIACIVYQKVKQQEQSLVKVREHEKMQDVVSDSGIVLLAPYIPMLFNRIESVADLTFKSDELRLKSLAFLHYAVYGDYTVPNTPLKVMPVLCGLASDFKPEELPILAGDEKNMVNGLLEAVVKNWGALGTTSADGLRTNFLIRKGSLNEVDGTLKLKVTQNAYDILLEKIPWGYSMVKFPWMNFKIDVEWR